MTYLVLQNIYIDLFIPKKKIKKNQSFETFLNLARNCKVKANLC